MKRPLLAGLILLAACQSEGPTLAQEWVLQAEGARPVTLDLREPGRAAGQAPCNRWFATVEGTLPAFRLTGIGATRMACPDLAAETAFLATLSRVTRAQVQEGMLVLEGPGGEMLQFLPKTP